jgi:type II secretory pathway pseudopilin PulG
MRLGSAAHQTGFAFPVILFMIAMFGLSLTVVGTSWSEVSRREKEVELLRVGSMYANAIAYYYRASPGSVKRYPASLDELLEDRRFVGVRRHLRYRYIDPVSHSDWGLMLAADGTIRGVYSLSRHTPLKKTAFEYAGIALPAARSYQDWKFVAPAQDHVAKP